MEPLIMCRVPCSGRDKGAKPSQALAPPQNLWRIYGKPQQPKNEHLTSIASSSACQRYLLQSARTEAGAYPQQKTRTIRLGALNKQTQSVSFGNGRNERNVQTMTYNSETMTQSFCNSSFLSVICSLAKGAFFIKNFI